MPVDAHMPFHNLLTSKVESRKRLAAIPRFKFPPPEVVKVMNKAAEAAAFADFSLALSDLSCGATQIILWQ